MTVKEKFTREERGFARRVANRMMTVEQQQFESESAPGKFYTARIAVDGKVYCDCRGWTVKKFRQPRACKHTKALLAGRSTHVTGDYLVVDGMGGEHAAD